MPVNTEAHSNGLVQLVSRPIYRLPLPPPSGNGPLDFWLRQLTSELNALPFFTFVLGDPSGTTAPIGGIAINVASGATQHFWLNQSGTTSSWSYVSEL